MNDDATQSVWRIEADSEAATAAIAADLASLLRGGDVVALSGELGVGKTAFARALIRAIAKDPTIEAPSPSFTLMQVYEGDFGKIVHADFYRIEAVHELAELGWEDVVQDAIVLVEWPERSKEIMDADHLDVALSYASEIGPNARMVTISGHGAFAKRLEAFKSLREFLRQAGWDDAHRAFLQGDASSRSYETMRKPNGESAILMISPARPDGPPIRFGRSYSAIARLAESIRAFVAVAEGLAAQGFSAPKIIARDLDAGLAIVEDLGREGLVHAEGPIPERYEWAIEALAILHSRSLPTVLPLSDGGTYRIPPYDIDALLIEVELLLDWYVDRAAKTIVPSGARAVFIKLWRHALNECCTAGTTWTLRDFHSPNLLWLPGREGVQRVGMIDFQDCVLGHPAYDVASLAQDARVTVPDELELRLIASYARKRRQLDESFEMTSFARAYAILGAQRATKILGIFARLDQRDGKPQYLAHMPRVQRYLLKGLRHPALQDIARWYATHLPHLFANDA
ncbi:tRNA (adenosine(37)-N6)-threonylcarbamoyltransferase complex ATPase subunit type 1 TsaE [Methylocystis bryophila]|uniref:tRNA threonylcarbamoyladenosine biosynthesis protein TsaE n=1 Tax=Methylocystis bryophila TaxID=655015 RepID=A0A1W6MYV6_9HYPH|nr:tRNA (adenosine(37)-N6)-threonylcarbamoyltransferase complex ATPase subunit type 1 TsaE [Methylocystis bryophila]ARN82758.1 tRNA (adenosine(37)-N6)-threonylcarbamoyltransferase complex ATPase subunit type 1 TsaE [Methylocystis bryophila]BDV38996.1 bifunctional tRNA (adenosine(37)-N6)-threonylcarbamoyltransferase complex ATPase subunit type 1 TsaE/phosphotransferase [Methylocystis bryophila]